MSKTLAQVQAEMAKAEAEEVVLGAAAQQLGGYAIGGLHPRQRGKSWFRDLTSIGGIDESADIDKTVLSRAYEALRHYQAAQPPRPMVVNKPLAEISNADLVMEMLKRGFAVMKLPEDGGPPEALRGTTD